MTISIKTDIEQRFKEAVPARKRSELIEKLVVEYLQEIDRKKGWEGMEQLREKLGAKQLTKDISAVELIRQDRNSH